MLREKAYRRCFFRIVIGITVLVLLLANGTGAVPVEQWNKTFGENLSDIAYSVQQTSDGGYILAGTAQSYKASRTTDAWLIKTDANGNKLWNKTFEGASDYGSLSVQEALDGGYVFAGTTNSSGDKENGWVVKTDANGSKQWEKVFGGANFDEFKSIQRTLDGGYIIAGSTQSYDTTTLIQAWLVKIDANGNEIWNKTFGTGIYYKYSAVSAKQTSDGGYIIAGNTGNPITWLIKTDSSGNQVWTKGFKESESSYAQAVDTQQTSDGGYILTGYKRLFDGTGTNVLAWLIKTDSTGNTLWNKTFGGKGVFDIVYSARQTKDGGYVLAGYTSLNNGSDGKALVIKTDANGNELWYQTLGEASMNIIQSVEQTGDGGYILAGDVSSYGPGNTDAWLVKLSSEARNRGISISKHLKERILSQKPLAPRLMYYPDYTTSPPNI